MKVLFLTSPQEDYLADSLLLGLRELLGDKCVDYPKAEVLYKEHNLSTKHRIYGNSFTLYSGLLEDIPVDRHRILQRVSNKEFDLIIFGSIWHQFGWFVQFRPWLTAKNTCVIDGADSPQPYPGAGYWWRRRYYWFLPRAHKDYLYFKREWTSETRFTPLARLLPKQLLGWLPSTNNLRKTAFSIPAEKVVVRPTTKTKDYAKHIVDEEVAARVPGATTAYAFSSEAEYYEDLRQSRFGITTKRSGWDCLRHYEIAANGAVPCFRGLGKKPQSCAPHGLNESNCVIYRCAEDLFAQIAAITNDQYAALQYGSLSWVRAQTSQNRARELLEVYGT